MNKYKTSYRVEYRFFWHGYNYCSNNFMTMDEVRAFIHILRTEKVLKAKKIRVITLVELL